MASTRNKSTRGNYAMEKKQNASGREWGLYANGAGGVAVDPAVPGNGLGGARIPASLLASNPIQIESFLWGIGSMDHLESGEEPQILRPDLTRMKSARLYANPDIIMPVPLVVPKGSRPAIP